MKPYFIGIAGPSGSGKTWLAIRVAEALESAVTFNLDSYYRNLDHLTKAERDVVNFDVPEMLDWDLINEHLADLAEGRAIEQPIYSFETHTRLPITASLAAGKYVVVEGIFALHDPRVRAKLDLLVYVRTQDDVCYDRRKSRDVVERGRTEESVREQYARTVRPGAVQFVWPTEKFATLVVSGTQAIEKSVEQVLAAIGITP